MNSKQLQYFLATAEQGSITGAARAVEVAQPAISLQLANLEHELKLKLFERDFRGVQLTEEGKVFERHARIILAQIEQAKSELMGRQNNFGGKVVVGLSQSICNVLSVDLLTEIEHRFANIEVVFRIGPSHIVNNWLAENNVDIALCYEDEKQQLTTEAIALLREDLYLYISQKPQNPAYCELALYGSIPFADLQHYEIFTPIKEDALTKLLHKQAEKLKVKLKTKTGFGQLMTTLHYVSQGMGLMISPSSSTFHLEQSKQIRPIKIIQPNLQRKVYLHLSEPAKTSAAAKVVYELIREVTASNHAKEHWRGTLLDKKYALPVVDNIQSLVAG
ncbi:LysR family transcriptional regulator [Paraglaciecola aquimarina]|uniref:LysR family transcriptional regulator n=1 Tax=Paraglaciecola aquimarina TaxID=1235557 RepID=A0ABU3SRQ4_9ALTE|nr:LysR family transcriptional regulator [Paraglaciecola aquimarina]MDU0352688.1 LysR family transcriptional regulator [Paraglaciecola aquimarina]